MKPIITTAFMALLAFLCCAGAWYYYPKIEVSQVTERKQLLREEESFETRDVRRIKVEQYDRTRNSKTEFELQFEQGSWVIPSKSGFPAGNSDRVPTLVTALLDKEVLELVSDEKNDHEKYGVLELEEAGAGGVGVGTVLTFEGRKREELGKLIVGQTPKDEKGQRYVRLAGQPHIYIIDFDDTVLTTALSDWTDGDLLRMDPRISLNDQVEYFEVDSYFVEQGESGAAKKHAYRARIYVKDGNWVYDFWAANENQSLPSEPTEKALPVNVSETLTRFVSQLKGFAIRDVVKKQPAAAQDLSSPKESQAASHFRSMAGQGFFHNGFDFGQHQFDSATGEITVAYRFGMQTKMFIGDFAGLDIANGNQFNRFLLVTAEKNPDLIPVPEEPSGDGTEENQEEAARKYQQEVNRRKELLKGAEQGFQALNQIHADWIYVVSEDVVSNLLPPADSWKVDGQ